MRQGIPTTLPAPKPYDTTVNHAPKRKDILTPAEKKLALRNALRYFEPSLHAVLAPEFAEELHKYAIAKDGLVWPNHVSDLKGWGSAAAKLYGVSSIPCTFLLDREGRILAKGLRGETLTQALQQIFGE